MRALELRHRVVADRAPGLVLARAQLLDHAAIALLGLRQRAAVSKLAVLR